MPRPPVRTAILGLVVAALAIAAIAFYALRPRSPTRLTLTPATYDDLRGWRDDRISAAIPAFLKSCTAALTKPDDALLDPSPQSVDFGRIRDWRPPCAAAALLPAGDDDASRRFFETAFAPLLAGNNGEPEGLFTGYFEIVLNGSRQHGGRSQTPLYRRPPAPGRYSRGEIEDGALAGQGLELLWVEDPIDAFFLEIQGSGEVRLSDGGTVRVNYDGANGQAYIAVGRLLIERGVIPREQMSMAAIRSWMAANPKDGAALRRENPAYVFFREIAGDGPIGAQQVVLTPERSLAVDRAFVGLGVPIWLEAQQRYSQDTVRRLVVAQDTGGAIKGPVRGDFYWGSGDQAGAAAGAMIARGRYYLLLPRVVAARQTANAAPH